MKNYIEKYRKYKQKYVDKIIGGSDADPVVPALHPLDPLESMPQIYNISPGDNIYIYSSQKGEYIKATIESYDKIKNYIKIVWMDEGYLFYCCPNSMSLTAQTEIEARFTAMNIGDCVEKIYPHDYLVLGTNDDIRYLMCTGKSYDYIAKILSTRTVTFDILKSMQLDENLKETDITIGYKVELRELDSFGIISDINETVTPINYNIELCKMCDDKDIFYLLREYKSVETLDYLDKFTINHKHIACKTSESECNIKNTEILYPMELFEKYIPRDINKKLFYSPNYVISPEHYIYDKGKYNNVQLIDVNNIDHVRFTRDRTRYISDEREIVLPPITVRPVNTTRYRIVDGTHRLDFARSMEYEYIPAIVQDAVYG